jgi:alanine racemase
MVKSDGYGLGVARVVAALEAVKPWGYGVATIEEGAELRSLGITRPVLVFTPLLAGDFADVRAHGLTPTLGDEARIHAWHSSGGGAWHLAIDTGMNRAGVPWARVGDLARILEAAPPEGAFTHFHSADANDDSMDEQLRRFEHAVSLLPGRPKYLHAENSPALERRAPSRWDLARPGVALYGVGRGLTMRDPDTGTDVTMPWLPVASLHGRIVEIRDVTDGETVSYGATWRAEGPRRIATVSAGYADGIRRSLSNNGVALVNGRRAPIAGIVTMDMTMLDVTGIACEVGEVATFLGRQGKEHLAIEEVARAGNLSPYELLVGLGLRAPRVYVQSAT